MDQNTINTVIVLRNDQTTVWEESGVVMLKGEVGIGYLDNGNVIAKLGDGQHSWKDLPQIEGVFETDQILTYNFGRHKTVNGKVNAGGKGMTTSEWLLDALSESLDPKTNYPTASLAAGTVTTDTGNYEIGSKITKFAWNGSHGNGSYVSKDNANVTYGSTGGTTKASGITDSAFTWSVSNSVDNATSNTEDGTFALDSAKYIQIDSTSSKPYAKLSGTVTLDASKAYTPYNNLGQEYPAGKITGFDAAGATTKTFTDVPVNVTGYRSTFVYIGTDCATAVNSDFLRNTAGVNKGNIGTTIGTLTIPAGTKRVAFAVPGTHDWHATNKGCEDTAGMNLDIKDKFTRTTGVKVAGANNFTAADYTLFEFVNPEGVSATTFKISIT